MKEEAIELRDSTQETLVREEIEETNSSKKRDSIIKEYRFADESTLEIISRYVTCRIDTNRISLQNFSE